ncbi:HSF-type DNA-binding-domain-containing protein [Limtongia smithiae]|uniref:HSF-type DNA-binding-domain-containing protein n=1 Tax=Limtongia smithiae TaxID=1125753 RepID=UPI0034CD230F
MADYQNSAATTTAASGAGSSSDFVKKLFKMLEDRSYRDIVRWSDAGDSFVVLETNEFTKSILPRHFKHSNFASFVRQLNKYDFHKVKSTDEGGICPYGESAWEFRHPDFQLHNKTQLDNIKRKAPAPRRTAQPEENSFEQMSKFESELEYLKGTQAILTKHLDTLAANYENALGSLISLQRSNDARDELIRSMLHHMQTVGTPAQVHSPQGRYPGSPDVDFTHGAASIIGRSDDFQTMGLNRSTPQEQSLEYLAELAKRLQTMSSTTSSQLFMLQQQFLKDGRSMKISEQVAAQNSDSGSNGNDNMGEPDSGMMDLDTSKVMEYTRSSKSPVPTFSQTWAVPPKVLLVEDDATSRRVSGKFLQIFGCDTDVAMDGLQAVNKMNLSKYDIVLMDIVMPNLDGVSASSLIRQFDPLTPIVAMTGNVSNNDVIAYYSHGMNDVLAKPFTKENLFDILEKHLIHLKEIKEI